MCYAHLVLLEHPQRVLRLEGPPEVSSGVDELTEPLEAGGRFPQILLTAWVAVAVDGGGFEVKGKAMR